MDLEATKKHLRWVIGTLYDKQNKHEAEAALNALLAEVERLKSLVPVGSVEQQKWMDLCDKASENETRSRKRAERAEAEVERLKAVYQDACNAIAKLTNERDEVNEALAACQATGGWYKDANEAALAHIEYPLPKATTPEMLFMRRRMEAAVDALRGRRE